MKSKLPALVCVFLATVGYIPATSAALVTRNLYSAGDGLLTYDEVTGLEWLDYSARPTYALQDFRKDSGNLTTLGFQFASRDELFNFLLDAGVNSVSSPWAPGYDYGPTPEDYQAYVSLLDLGFLGGTHIETVDLTYDTRPFFEFSVADPLAMVTENAYLSAHLELGVQDAAFVRYAPVPLPASIVLFISGLLSLVGWRRVSR